MNVMLAHCQHAVDHYDSILNRSKQVIEQTSSPERMLFALNRQQAAKRLRRRATIELNLHRCEVKVIAKVHGAKTVRNKADQLLDALHEMLKGL